MEFSAYGKVNGKFMRLPEFSDFTRVFFLSGISFMQWAQGILYNIQTSGKLYRVYIGQGNKTGVLNLTPVGVNRGPHPQVLTLHPRVST